MNRILLHIIPAILLLFAVSCGEKKLSPKLTEINEIANRISGTNTNSDRGLFLKADSLLRSVDVSKLSENDRMYHSLLQVKLTDKAYLRHPGDTIIRPVVEYAEKQRRCGFLPEALYYGGRVYSDIGDSFTALRYYQDALDNLPEDKKNTLLHAKILSQTGKLLHSLRLHEEAIPYIKESIRVDSIIGDPLLIMFNTELLAEVYRHQDDYGMARTALEKARKLAVKVAPVDTSIIDVNLAEMLYHQGRIHEALTLIRPAVEATDSLSKNLALANAARIYKEAGIGDTAAIYALRLVNQKDPSNHKIGYRVIFSPEMKDVIPPDTLARYNRKYHSWMESYLDRNGDMRAISQQSLYNYRIHERESIETGKMNTILRGIIIALVVLIILGGGAIIYFFISRLRFRNGEIAALNEQLEKIFAAVSLTERSHSRNNRDTQQESSFTQEMTSSTSGSLTVAPAVEGIHDIHSTIESLRNNLIDSLCDLIKKPDFRREVHLTIKQSDINKSLREMLSSGDSVGDDPRVWENVKFIVHLVSPKFDCRLDMIMGEPPDQSIRRVAYLMKFGFSNNEISALMIKGVSTISGYRARMCEKIFGEKNRYQDLENLISIL